MLRLTALLCASLYAIMLIGGRDYGQMRPGLMAARQGVTLEARPGVETALRETMPTGTGAEVIAATYAPPAAITVPLVLPLVRPETAPTEPAPAAAKEPAPAAVPEVRPEVRYVNVRAVNVRQGPSTDHPVIGKLIRGEAVGIVAIDPAGWAHIRIEGDGIDGFVATRFLTPDQPATN